MSPFALSEDVLHGLVDRTRKGQHQTTRLLTGAMEDTCRSKKRSPDPGVEIPCSMGQACSAVLAHLSGLLLDAKII